MCKQIMHAGVSLSGNTQARLWSVIALIWLFPLVLIQATFTEELIIHPHPDGTTLAHFDFEHRITESGEVLPAKVQALLAEHPLQELHLAFVLGRWFADKWGPPPTTVTPSGATLQARFQSFDQPAGLQQAWGNLTHALSGLFCASLNFLADTSLLAMPSYPFLHLDSGAGQQITNTSGNSSPWLYGSLPREAVCTENLTPWLKLLPCHGRQGLTQLLDRSTLYAASFHSMQVHLTVQTPPEHSSANDTAVSGSCSLEAGAKVGQVTPAFSPISLRQTLTIVIRPNQLHGGQPPGQLIGWGTPMQQNLTLQRLFNVHAVAACPKASHTHIYWQLPKALYSKLYSGSPALNASAIDNSLYTFSPAPDAVIASSDSLFALYDLTASSASSSNNKVAAEAPTSSNPTAVTLSNSSNKSRSEALNSNTQHDNASQICVQLSLTWRQQPAPWDPPGTPLQVQQLLAGRLGDRGSLVLHIGFRALAQQAESYDGSGSAEHLAQQADYEQQAQQEQQAQHDKKQGKQQTHHEEQQDGDTGHRNNSHEFCVFQMVPWHFQLLFHTLKLHVDGQETSLGSVMTAHTLQSAEGQGTTATIELCLRIPRQARSVRLSIAFQKAFLTVFDHPPDANRGFDMPSALITNMLAQPLHQAPWTVLQQEGADQAGTKLENHRILQHLSTLSGRHVYSNGVLIPMPTPDFSMPYNVCCLSCTVLALYVMGINAAVFSKPEHDVADAKQNKAAKRRQLASVLLLVLVFGSLAVSTDKALQRQLKSVFGMGSDD